MKIKAQLSHSKAPQEVRIVGGRLKRSKLNVLNLPDLRPTPARIRETLFNWLGQDLSGCQCMDAFAGTGALGFEALSRGAKEVIMMDHSAVVVEQLEKESHRLGVAKQVKIKKGNALDVLEKWPSQSLDVLFLDPPFSAPASIAQALEKALSCVAPSGWVYVESDQLWDAAFFEHYHWTIHRQAKAGRVYFYLLTHQQHEPRTHDSFSTKALS